MTVTASKAPIESVYQVEQKLSEGTDVSAENRTQEKNILDTLVFPNWKYSLSVPKATSFNPVVREQATVSAVAINKPLFDFSNSEPKMHFGFTTEKPKKNVTSSGIGTVAKRFETGKDKKQDPINDFLSNPDATKWKELASLDIQDVFGGKC